MSPTHTVGNMFGAVVRGVGASVLASTAMGGFMLLINRLGALGEPPPRKLTRQLLTLSKQKQLAHGTPLTVATTAAHFVYGGALGAIFGLFASRVRSRTARTAIGTGFGTAVWAVSYAGWIPAAKLLPAPRDDRADRVLAMVAAHALFGAVLGATFMPRRAPLEKDVTPRGSIDHVLDEAFPAIAPPALTQPPGH